MSVASHLPSGSQQSQVLLFGIAGGSCSGKSTLARILAQRLGSQRAMQLSFDSYYRPLDGLDPGQRSRVNFDHPDSLDLELFVGHLDRLKAGDRIEQPQYDFATHSRRMRTIPAASAPFVLVDGILLLAFPEVVSRLDRTVFLEVPEEVRLRRRLARDTVERGRTEESVRKQFEETVAPMHREFVEPGKDQAHRILRHGCDLAMAAEELISDWCS